ncbi:Type I restriction modification system specificity (S) subunit, HsdS [Mycoplasma yeatsii 13926]|uniref:Type I restriction modification system specificity (S) subunit, HsdS n=1 Tax=Mycoplasma yeatsii 13926 TaxID=1188240 RepID=S6G6T2_9MOLU|nr:restriction endonuclease subunit S [Mycoplasma yeatsii]EOA07068.1 Type I restriction modification system specificity (S) subunit, HsdS [Mycoplasma yeatsii 13926]
MKFKTVKLKEIGTIIGGGTPNTQNPEFYDGDINWITPKDLSEHKSRYISKGSRTITIKGLKSSSAKIVPRNTVLFSSRAPIGYVAIAESDLSTNQGFKNIIPNDNIHYLFLYYLLSYSKNYIEGFASGTTFKEISSSSLSNIEFKIPELIEDQIKISNLLGLIDSKIELNNKINDNLEKLLDYNFKFFFKNVFNIKKSKLDGAKISDLCSVLSGYNFKPSSYTKKGLYKVITIKNVTETGLNLEKFNVIKQIPNNIQDFCILKPQDILITLTGNVGRTAIVFENNCVLNQRVGKIKPHKEVYKPFLYCLFKSYPMRKKLEELSNGSAQANLSISSILNTRVDYDENVIEEFSILASKIITKITLLNRETYLLKKIKNHLIPVLMNGQVTIE